MFQYLARRCLLLPITLFFIILVNFVIINLAPGEPSTIAQVSAQGNATRKEGSSAAFGSDLRYLRFREHYGLTLPILVNSWPWLTYSYVTSTLTNLSLHSPTAMTSSNSKSMSVRQYNDLRITFGDQARFVMPLLLRAIEDPQLSLPARQLAVAFFIRGGTRPPYLGPNLSSEQKLYNKKIAADALFLSSHAVAPQAPTSALASSHEALQHWFDDNRLFYNFTPSGREKLMLLFFDTRFCHYMGKVLTLDFGTLRNDDNKTVISEVTRRFKYSLTLSLIPMAVTFLLCQLFAVIMALKLNRWPDHLLNLIFLVLYATPIFVVAPFLIEKVALNHTFPFSNIPIPISGFTSPDAIYSSQTSLQRLSDIATHLFLPLVAITYGTLAAQARLSRTAILEVLRQEYVRTAWAKGASLWTIMFKHVGRNAAITIVTSLAGSLGLILGGSLIVETLFDINGFGKFFYDAVISRDYNVIMFSALAGAFLSLLGYLLADIAYTLLDPRVTLD
jgi:peptide/nickel transport system permease protein